MEQSALENNIGFLVHDVARLMRTTFDANMKPLGITRSQWWLLVYLYRDNGLTQTELAEVLDISKVTLGGIIDRLERKGWVERRPDIDDRRANRVFLAEGAEEITAELVKSGRSLMKEIAKGMSEEDQILLANLLSNLKTNLLEVSPELIGSDGDKAVGA